MRTPTPTLELITNLGEWPCRLGDQRAQVPGPKLLFFARVSCLCAPRASSNWRMPFQHEARMTVKHGISKFHAVMHTIARGHGCAISVRLACPKRSCTNFLLMCHGAGVLGGWTEISNKVPQCCFGYPLVLTKIQVLLKTCWPQGT